MTVDLMSVISLAACFVNMCMYVPRVYISIVYA